LIELNGVRVGGVNGLNITAGHSTVRGLVINRFGGNGILFQTKGSNLVEGCFIGTDPPGTLDLGNSQAGVFLNLSGTNTVGGTAPAARNIISGNSGSGVRIGGAAST